MLTPQRKRNILSVLVALIGSWVIPGRAMAQITSDGSLSTLVTSPDGLNFTITEGDHIGNNLFHSFDEFSVPNQGAAVFNHAGDIETIFSRVTGSASIIDGIIQTHGTTDLFFLNPNGIIFGPNADLNIGGSFLATTADGVLFENNQFFSATDNTTIPLLTLSTPIGLQFGSSQNSILVQGNGHNLDLDLDTFQPIRDNRPVGLQVDAKQTLALIGGDILIEGGNLTANQGRVELGSVTQSGNVALMATADGLTVNYEEIESFGNLSFTQASSVEVSGAGSGNLHFQAGSISVVDESAIIHNILGADESGNVLIRAADSVEIIGTETEYFPSVFFNDNELGSTGNAGHFRLETSELRIANNAFISSSTAGTGRGGDLTVVANDVDIAGATVYPGYDTGLLAQVLEGGTGQGGNLTINAQNASFRDGALIAVNTNDLGNAGNLTISAEIVEVVGNTAGGDALTFISADTNSSGQGGDLLIDTNSLRVTNGGQLAAGTFGEGDGGSFIVNANTVDVIGLSADGVFPSGLFVDTLSSGNGGNLVVNADQLNVLEGGNIFAGTLGDGNGGSLILNAQAVNVIGMDPDTLLPSYLGVETLSSGNGGNLVVNADQLNVLDGGNIVVGTLGDGNGGSLAVYASESINVIGENKLGNNFSIITSATDGGSGKGGNIILETPYLRLVEGGSISAATFGSGNGGNLVVQANVVEVSDAAVDFSGVLNGIVTFVAPEFFDFDGNLLPAATGNGGDITINANQLLLRRGGQLDSSTFGEGRAGSLNLNVETVEVSGISDVLEDGTQIPSRIISLSDTDAAAGTITLSGDTLTVREDAEINVSNLGQGNAGNLNLTFDNVRLEQGGRLLAEVNGGHQGNINVTANELLLLRRGSSITTNATGASTGGNIVIDAPIILGIPNENSDIMANAVQGNGGNITLFTGGLLGLALHERNTLNSDITASSEFGLNGTVAIINPGETFNSETLELSENFTNADDQIGTHCNPRDSMFVSTGRGGLPLQPSAFHQPRPWIDLRAPITDSQTFSASADEAVPAQVSAPASITEPVQEVTGVEIAPDGVVQLVTSTAQVMLPKSDTLCDHRAAS